jgi:elongation factor 2 kinase
MGLVDTVFDHTAFHRFESGEIKPRHFRGDTNDDMESNLGRGVSKRGTVLPKKQQPQPPMKISEETMSNLGKIHYHLACLHGADRFPEMVPSNGECLEDRPSHCISSVVFHLCCAASLRHAPACLALARARIGLDSFVCVFPGSVCCTNIVVH